MSYVCKVENGEAKVYKSNGSHYRTLCRDAISGVVSGDEVHVTMSDGKVRIYNLSTGSHIRTI
jgi:hypothetical protein